MNELTNEVTIKDLRELGRQGGATAYLLDGQEMQLTGAYGLIKRKGFIGGEQMIVEIIEQYTSIYSSIRTIKRNGILVARRIKRGNQTVLTLTGKGYHRKDTKR